MTPERIPTCTLSPRTAAFTATEALRWGQGHLSDLEAAFCLEVFNMLKKEEKITDLTIENMMGWYRGGFNVYCGERIW